jgi:hypothetical protein
MAEITLQANGDWRVEFFDPGEEEPRDAKDCQGFWDAVATVTVDPAFDAAFSVKRERTEEEVFEDRVWAAAELQEARYEREGVAA